MDSRAVRLGGLCGIGAATTAIPAYVVGSPELPNTPAKLSGYYERAEQFIAANGTIPLIHLFLGIVFISVLVAILRAAMGPSPAVYMTLIGGSVFIALTAVGLAAEVAIPAAIARFGDVVAPEVVRPFLALSVWLYHYSQIGSAIVIFATSYGIWRTGVLPKWTAVGALLGVAPLAHTWIGLPAAYSTVAWVGLMGLLLLVLSPKAPVDGPDKAPPPVRPVVEAPVETAPEVPAAETTAPPPPVATSDVVSSTGEWVSIPPVEDWPSVPSSGDLPWPPAKEGPEEGKFNS